MNNLYFVYIPLSDDKENSVWQVPAILGSEPKTFQKSAVKSALKYAKEVALAATIKTDNRVRYYPILMGQNRIIEGQNFSLSSPTRSRAGIGANIRVVRQVFNIREKLAPDKKHRIYVGEIVVDGEIVDVYTNVVTVPVLKSLPMGANTCDWREGAFFRACDELDALYPEIKPQPERAKFSDYSYNPEPFPTSPRFGGRPTTDRSNVRPTNVGGDETDFEQRLRQIVIDALEEAATPIDRNGT